jgi:hypothetical protein
MKYARLFFFWTCLILAGCGKEKVPSDIQKSLDRVVYYINQYNLTYSRLPTRDEYRAWWKTNDLVGVVDYQITPENTNEYQIYIWLGERTVIYSSKSKTINEVQ